MKHTKKAATCLMAVGLITMVAAITASAASAPALTGQIALRALTPEDKTLYSLPSTLEVSGGLSTIGVGTPAYLEAEVNIAIAASNIVSVTWVLTNQPYGSVATLTNSPLGPNVPIYEPSARTALQVAYPGGRTLLRPDVVGSYTVVATIVTVGSGSTNLTQTITAATYEGVATCELCHSGSTALPPSFAKYQPWTTTAHSMIFSNGIDGYLGSHYSASCLPCHTVGYDTTPSSLADNGFYSVSQQLGWTFPAVLSPTNFASLPFQLQNLGNIQCENCHGPGSYHAEQLGNTNFITRTVNAGDCNQCHDDAPTHQQGTEWMVSAHGTESPTGPYGTSPSCMTCHSANGFIARATLNTNGGYAVTATTNVTFSPLTCPTCHEPHGETIPTNNPYLIRAMSPVTMPDGTVVTNAGEGALCLECHQNRNGSATNQLVQYPAGRNTWFGGSSFGVHDNPQGDMIEGINANTYGQTIPSSAHLYSVTNLCVGCHMQTVAKTDPAFLQAGGHTFNMTYNAVTTNGATLVTNTLAKVDVCVECHGPISSFNFLIGDLEGIGVIEGCQTAVSNLLNTLSMLLPNSTYQSNSSKYLPDGLVKTIGRNSIQTNWPQSFLKAAYNWQFVSNDGSLGVHNTPYAVGLLKASIADLTGNPGASSLSQSNLQFLIWQYQYFGSATNPNAAPNATPAGDGVPNWLKYSLGLNPLIAGIQTTNGVVWADGTTLGGSTNTIQIYTAAEVAFDTQTNANYFIQECTSLSSGWQTIAGPITGTGEAVSYVTPTRENVQQYFRVYHNP
jgi:Zn finger protein HypA/HybF involved in hydrogenase expression